MSHHRERSRWPAIVTAVGVFGVALATLWPMPDAASLARETPPLCLLCGDRGVVDVVLNVVLFMPLGLGLRGLGWPVRRAVFAGFLLSLTVEGLQFATIAGRDASLSDVIFNTTGCAVGVWCATAGRSLLFPSVTAARRLAVAWSLMGIVASVVLARAWAPHAPNAPRYWGQWAHRFPDTESLRGTILAASINGHPAPDGPLPRAVDWQAQFGDSVVTAEVLAVGLLPVGTKAQVFAVTNGANGFLAQFEQRGCRISFRSRPLAARWKLNFPAVWVADVCGAGERDTSAMVGQATRAGLTIRLQAGDRTVESHLDLTLGLTWVFFAPMEIPRPWFGILTALWILAYTLPLGRWCGRGGRPSVALVLGWGVIAAVFGVVPWLTGIAPTHGMEWSVALGGVVVGWWSGVRGRVRGAGRP